MIKALFLSLALVMTAATSLAASRYDGSEAKVRACAAADESWMRRFGQYIVTYDWYNSNAICRNMDGEGRHPQAYRAGCRIDGRTIIAGYYCKGN
jgi:hypothetical protein